MVPLEAVLTQSQMQKTKQKKSYKSVINTEKSQIYEESIVLAPRNTSHQNTAVPCQHPPGLTCRSAVAQCHREIGAFEVFTAH